MCGLPHEEELLGIWLCSEGEQAENEMRGTERGYLETDMGQVLGKATSLAGAPGSCCRKLSVLHLTARGVFLLFLSLPFLCSSYDSPIVPLFRRFSVSLSLSLVDS